MLDEKQDSIPILMFHNIGTVRIRSRLRGMTVPPILLASYISLLRRRGYTGISISEVVDSWNGDSSLPTKPIVFTFDDGFEGVYKHGLPLIERAGWRGTLFIITDCVGGYSSWMQSKGEGHHRIMNWDQIKDSQRRGLEIGAHTQSHPELTAISHEQARLEILNSKHILEDRLGTAVRQFAFPYGDYNSQVQEMVREAGFDAACGIIRGRATRESDRFAIPRCPITSWRISPWRLLREVQQEQAV